MRISNWKDYELLDTSNFQRLERWGDIILIRPDPQVIWQTEKNSKLWDQAHAIYHRSKTGGGYWENIKSVPQVWNISYKELKFNLKPMGFKHTGLFPEQAVNWDFVIDKVKNNTNPQKVLNLFGYTGGATLACAKAGAQVCHVDASKGMVNWGKENATISGFGNKPIRWIVDDCLKFVKKEQRRGNKYTGIIMDPPSYGRGPNGEIWKIEDQLFELVQICESLLAENANFFVLNSYTTGLSCALMEYLLNKVLKHKRGGMIDCQEIGLPVTSSGLILPCGSTAIWQI